MHDLEFLKDVLTVVVGPIIVQITVEVFKEWRHSSHKKN